MKNWILLIHSGKRDIMINDSSGRIDYSNKTRIILIFLTISSMSAVLLIFIYYAYFILENEAISQINIYFISFILLIIPLLIIISAIMIYLASKSRDSIRKDSETSNTEN